MRDAIKSAFSLAWATSLFGATQATRLLAWSSDGGGSAAYSFAQVGKAAARELRDPRRDEPRSARPPEVPMAQPPAGPMPGRLDVSRVVVLGEGLAAGAGDFALSEESQATSFVVQAARQMNAPLVVPYLQSPGILGAPGLPHPPVILPNLLQTIVVDEFPLRRRHQNLAIPGYELSDCLRRRPVPPLVHRDDPRQTVANLVLGLPALTHEPGAERPTQLEYALQLRPTLAIVALGYAEALRAAFGSERDRAPSSERWAADFEQLVRRLRETGAEVVLATVPDPSHTAACMPLDDAARVLCAAPDAVAAAYGLERDDCLTVAGVTRVASELLAGHASELDSSCVVRRTAREAVSAFVRRLNEAIEGAADRHGAHILPLADVFARVRGDGLDLGGPRLTADLLGGFFTLNGCYPGATGHALIANELLRTLNDAAGASFPMIDLASVASRDSTAGFAGATGGYRSFGGAQPQTAPPRESGPRQRQHRARREGGPLRLPPSLEMTVPLCRDTSYHGDAIRVVDCADERESKWGSCAGVLFGGPVLFDSHLTGSLHIRFSPPEDGRARFEVRFDGFAGEDGTLSAPMFFRWPVTQCRVLPEPGTVASGTVDLDSGESHDVTFSVRYLNSALQALVAVNPNFPDQPIVFPGQYGSAWARFEQRDDESLDFTFYGSTFLPLGSSLGGQMVRWALPFIGAGGTFASIPARGLAMHPHLHLSTRELDDEVIGEAGLDPGHADAPIDLPHNSLCELTLFTRRSSFGDRFTLNSPELGGTATGRSHLLGRLLLQTGEPFGNSMPVVVSLLGPGGMLGQSPPAPLASLFPGRLTPGPTGHDEFLRFPTRNYFLDGVTLVDDPFDLSVGAIDLRTGRFINHLLHRGFIGQDLFFSLVRVEPRTPQSSFLFRGPAAIERTADGRLLLRLRAIVRVPYPAGFLFPAPDLTTAITIGENSVLDPYLWLRGAQDDEAKATMSVSRSEARSSTGEIFSYRLELRDDAERPLTFEYANHSQGATFRLDAVSWIGRSKVPVPGRGESDVVSFAGFGRWSKDPTGRAHQVTGQIAAGAEHYVSIQIDGGLVSNVNTKPVEEAAALP